MAIEKMQGWNMQDITLHILKQIFLDILDKLATLKHKYIGANQSPFMNKTLNKLVMDRSRLENRYLKNNTSVNWIAYKKTAQSVCFFISKTKKGFLQQFGNQIRHR